MFNNLVIGVDGREGGHRAIALAKQLAASGAVLTLANVYGARMLPGRGAGIALIWESEASEALLERERESSGLPSANTLRSSEPSVGRGLHEIAEHVKADLLVIGSTHRERVARGIVGDDTADVLHGAPCPVAIAPLHYDSAAPPTSVGVACDGSAESLLALAAGRVLAERFGAKLRVLAVVPVHVKPYWERVPARSPEANETEARLAKVRELRGVALEVLEGDPSDQLAQSSEDLSLLILGTRSQGAVRRVVAGSVATDLALRCACPLLIWPRSAVPDAKTAAAAQVSNVQS